MIAAKPRSVAIVGIGSTKIGELWDYSLRDLAVESGVRAVSDAGMSGKEIQAIWGGNMSAGQFLSQEHVAALIVDYVGLSDLHIPATRVEQACASGGAALREAILAVASGYYDIVMAAGIEKMTDVGGETASKILASAADQEWEALMGATFPALYALIAQAHIEEFGTTPEQLAAVAVKNHRNAKDNPHAHFRNVITKEQVLNSPMVSSPLHVLDCSPLSDGSVAVVVTSAEIAKEFTDTPIYVKATAQASDYLSLSDRKELTMFESAVIASRNAYQQAGLEPTDIDVCEVHDCFTIAEIIAIEDLGFFDRGMGGRATEEGETEIGSRIPINPSGGLKASGHPVGATGIKQVYEIVQQLRGEADKRQVNGAEIGMTHNVGGSGATCVVHIFSRTLS
ncbi:MAG: thiolase domain-containing protein [Methanophagales archaeon]|nr:thiolase domain-containing protein [Methanophagales archaeon]